MKTKLIQPILSAMVAIAKLSVSQPGRVKTLSEQPFPYPQQVTLPS
ncbi:hypothetical protein NON20_24860 (plasmid) [Synechocystis sp. B12]|nr:hypothetical protein NON20_24860 [Synechocystis sp. B12]